MASVASALAKSSRRTGAACCCVAALIAVPGAALAEPLGVVELFTSQGCSSCPPADDVLGHLAEDSDVVALTFAVDYWDYLGWKDSFARPEFTKRQRAYAEAQGRNGIYTPQVVVNGRDDIVGSDEAGIETMMRTMRRDGTGLAVPVEARIAGDRVLVSVPARASQDGKPAPRAAVWIASYRTPQKVEIERGENGGRTVTYHNVVDRWQVLGMWDGDALTVELPLSDIVQAGTGGLAVILQSKVDGRPGPILGAAKIDLDSGRS